MKQKKIASSYGEEIKMRRTLCRYSRKELSDIIGISVKKLKKIEKNKEEPLAQRS